jgi:hypothetical protein
MSKQLGARFRANVVGYLALFVALGGTSAWAVDKITSKEIARGAVRSKHVAPNAIKSKHVKDGNITNADIDPAVLSGLSSGITSEILGQVVQGEARVLSFHDTFSPQANRPLMELPGGYGALAAECRTMPAPSASIHWNNTTGSDITVWSTGDSINPIGVVPPGNTRGVASHFPTDAGSTFGLMYLARGTGASRTSAVVHAMPIQSPASGPCTYDVQVTYHPGG